jgi:hypothetical protein
MAGSGMRRSDPHPFTVGCFRLVGCFRHTRVGTKHPTLGKHPTLRWFAVR